MAGLAGNQRVDSVPRQVYARIRPLGQEEEEPIVQAAGEKRLRLQRSGSGSSGFDSPALESATR